MCPELLQRFAEVSDGRSEQGRVHPVAVVLSLCAAAVVAGMGSFTAIAGWVADVPGGLLARLYGRASNPPSKATIWRVVTGADPVTVDAVIGAWLSAQAAARASAAGESETGPATLVAIAVDGKTVRGATDAEGNQVHLLAAATHGDALVLGQIEVGAKTNEIPMFAPLLDTLADADIDLASAVITADALHTQRAHATYLHDRGAGFVFTVKDNQPRLFAALDALDWSKAPTTRDIDTGHGRITTRTIQVLPTPPNLPFPHVNQVWLVERYVTDPTGTPRSAVATLGVTNLPTHPGCGALDLPDSEPTRIAYPEERISVSTNRRSFTPEYKDEAAKMVVQLSRPVASVAWELGLKERTLRNWVTAYRRTHADDEPPLTVSERARLRELEKEVRELRLEKEFMGKAAAFFAREYR